MAAIVSCAGAPAIAQPPPLSAYGELPGIERAVISPSGENLSLIARVSGERRMVVLDAERKLRAQIPAGDSKIRDLAWIGEDRVVLISSATSSLGANFFAAKYELFGALVIPLDGSKSWVVFKRPQSIGETIFGDYGIRLINREWQGFFSGVELSMTAKGAEFVGGNPVLYAVDLATESTRKIARAASAGHRRRWLIDSAGNAAVTLDISDRGHWEILNVAGKTIATGEDPTGDIGLVSLGRDGATAIYSLEDDAAGKIRWFEIPLVGGSQAELFADLDIDRTYVDKSNGRLLGYLQGGSEKPRPVFYDSKHQAAAHSIYRAFGKVWVDIQDWTPDFRHVLIHTSGNGDSGSWFVVDIARLKADIVGNDRPLILPEQVGPISTVAYRATDGLAIEGILTLPPNRAAKALPAIILPHGRPNTHDEERFDWWAQAFASRGYAVFQPNFRGSTNGDDAFRRAGNGQWGRKMQTDMSDGLAELVRQGIVDPKRVCIMGSGYGGYAALAGVTLQNGIYRCAVAVAPVSDLREMYTTDYRESGDSKMISRSMRESLGTPGSLGEVSPRRFAERADAPILLIHGRDDTVVPFHQSSAMESALRSAGKPVELVALRQEDHWLSRAATRKQMLEAAMAFVQKHNPAN